MGDRFIEVRGRGLQDLLDGIGQISVVTHQDGPGGEVGHVIERLVAHRALYFVPVRDLPHHLLESVGLALAGFPRDRGHAVRPSSSLPAMPS